MEILQNRLIGFYPDLVTENAVILACRSLETFSDVRRLLQVIRRALFLAEEENRKTNPSLKKPLVKVLAPHISQSLKETRENHKSKILLTLSEHERLILLSILSERSNEMTLKTIINRYEILIQNLALETALNGTEFNLAVSNLINLGFIGTDTPRKDGSHRGLQRAITLNVDRTDLIFDMRDDKVAVRVFGREFFSNLH